MILANKYRPSVLADFVGQEVIVKTLTNACEKKKLHHAHLMVGAPGTGKTSCARVLAAMENCETSPGLNPCGKCRACKLIHIGKHPDIIEIDAASEAGKVEQIRALKAGAQFNSVDSAAKKYYICDEAHAMSSSAADSMLKLLEEPPSHVRFVLATTDVQKLRPAIQSRCQRHDFKKIYWGQIAEQLDKIAKLEKITVDSGALNLCAKISNGSMRTAIQNFEKLTDFAGNIPITIEHAEKVFVSLDDIVYAELMDGILGLTGDKVDASKCFKLINKMLSTGVDFNTIYEGLTEYLRKIIVVATCSNASEFISVTDDLKSRLKMQIKKISELNKLEAILEMVTKLNQSRVAIVYNINAETLLQKFVIESIFAFKT